MSDLDLRAEKPLVVQLVRLHARVQGIATGVVAAVVIFVATNWLVIKGGETVGQHLGLLGQYFIGYRVSFLGSLVGAAYGFVVGFALGYIVSRIYNLCAGLRDKRTQ